MYVCIAYIHTYVHTCKDAIQRRPCPLPPIVYFQRADFKYIYLIGILRTNDYAWSAFFLILKKLKILFEQKKKKTYRNAAQQHFLCETIVTHRQKREGSCRVWSFFPFLKILKIVPFMIKKTNPLFFSFGVSAITPLLIILLTNVAYF